jgi:hypothetical protein
MKCKLMLNTSCAISHRGVWAVIADLQFFLVIACRPPRRKLRDSAIMKFGFMLLLVTEC